MQEHEQLGPSKRDSFQQIDPLWFEATFSKLGALSVSLSVEQRTMHREARICPTFQMDHRILLFGL
jgi:hypothetical protein